MTISLPVASDTARSEARFILDAAKRVAECLKEVEEATSDAQARIRATQYYVEDLDRHGSIDHGAAQEILKRLLSENERRRYMISKIIQLFKAERFPRRIYGECQRCGREDYLPWATDLGIRYCGQCWENDALVYVAERNRLLDSSR